MGLGSMKHFTVKSHFICIDEATSSNMFFKFVTFINLGLCKLLLL
jgi:hypothetical protein